MRVRAGDGKATAAFTLVELLRARAEQQPDLPLYTFLIDGESPGASLTCAELDRNARAIASVLAGHRLRGERVILLYPTGVELISALFGCLYAGAIAVPAPSPDADRPHRTLTRLRSIAAAARPMVALTTATVLDTAKDAFASAPELSDVRWLTTDTIAADLAEAWRDPGVGGDTLAYLQFTSGSTALPKGVMVSHANVLRNSESIGRAWGYGEDSVAVTWVPQYHDDGLVHGTVVPLHYGFRSYLMSPLAFVQQPLRWLEAISRHRATHSGGPNFAYDLCVRKIPESQRASLDLSRWGMAYNAAEPIRSETLEKFAQAFGPCGFRFGAFRPAYGLAEATLLVSTRRVTDEPRFATVEREALERDHRIVAPSSPTDDGVRTQTLVGCGHAVPGTAIVIAHPGSLTRCAPDEVGEIWVSDPSVAHGYWNRPEETAATFRAFLADTSEGPFLRTGDLGFMKDGELYVSGRLKDLIIIRGQNHYPQDVEWTVQESHPALRPGCCAAFSVDASGEEQLVIVAEVQRRDPKAPGPPPDHEAVVGAIREAVSGQHGLHAYVVQLLEPGTIPKTSSGKIQRHACRAGFLAGTLNVIGDAADALPGRLPSGFARERTAAERADAGGHEPIAIVGLGCRFPGAKDPEAFWRMLCDGVEAVTEIPPDRWDVDAFYDPAPGAPRKMSTRRGGFVENIDRFDARFFGISPREADRLDPQQRMLLEVGFEALEDAGLPPARLAGTRTGVFVGYASNDYGRIQMDPSLADAYMPTGNAGSIAANRLSYLLDLRGPSMIVDTACSSALVAVHLACQSIWKGESTLALAGGVNVVLSPVSTINFSKAGMLSPDGRCKAFDASANGYVRGEGAGIAILKPLSRALEDGDPIYALIRGTAVNQDGHSDGLTVPSQEAQEAVFLEACHAAGVSPGQIDYVEAHGTGTSVGDPIEAKALGRVLAIDRAPGRLCALGSVKTNIAHLEAASGIAGLMKVALMLRHRRIPPSLHFREPNPLIPFDRLPVRVQTTLGDWPQQTGPALAGVNSFGFGGTNAHAILQDPPPPPSARPAKAPAAPLQTVPPPKDATRRAHLVPLSARSPEALRDLATAWADRLTGEKAEAGPALGDLAWTASLRRDHHEHRLAVVSRSKGDLAAQLRAFVHGEPRPAVVAGRRKHDRPPKIAFVFPGQGPQWWAMGRQLLEEEPVYRAAIERCDALLRRHADWSLLEELGADESRSRLAETSIAQPALFALQISLAELWRSWGVVPDAVVGHSMGEVAAACVAGALDLTDAARIIVHRGRLMQGATGKGKMAALGLSPEEAGRALAGYEDRVSVASINGPSSVVLSGETAALGDILAALEARGITSRLLPVSYAFHSQQMEPFLDDLAQALGELRPRPASCPIYSTLTGEIADGMSFDAGYWRRNVREPVRFAAAIEGLARDGHRVFMEIGPHPTLAGAIGQCLAARGSDGDTIASLRRDEEDGTVMLAALGALHVLGYPVDWPRLHPEGGRCVPLPLYPWQRERYWLDIQETDLGLQSWGGGADPKRHHPLLARHLSSAHPAWDLDLDRQSLSYLRDHRIRGEALLPATAYVEAALAAAEAAGLGAHDLAEIELHKPMFLPEGEARRAQVVVAPDERGEPVFRIYSRSGGTAPADGTWTCHATGKVRTLAPEGAAASPGPIDIDAIRAHCPDEIAGGDFYADLASRGFNYGPAFQAVERVWRRDGEAVGALATPPGIESGAGSYHCHPALLDAALQVLAAAIPARAADPGTRVVYLPVRMERVRVLGRHGARAWSHARLRRSPMAGADVLEAEIHLLDENGRMLVEISGLRLQRVDRSSLPGAVEDLRHWLFDLRWELSARPGQQLIYPAADALVSPIEVAARVQARLPQTGAPAGLEPYQGFRDGTETLATAFVVLALRQLGWDLETGSSTPDGSLAERLGVAPRHRRYLNRLLERLAAEGILRRAGADWEVCRVPPPHDTAALARALLVRYPACEAEITILARCGDHLAEVLRGVCEPLQLLFPDGALDTSERLYEDSPYARAYNSLVQEALRMALERQPPGRPVRVLEIGAGTGGLTGSVLSALPASRTEYVYSDVSPAFLAHGERKFGRHPFVRYRLLDIEQDPAEQGFGPHQFDIVVASQVLHATSDLRRTLQHVQRLLTSEGMIVFLEGEDLHGVHDVVFAMTEGWWKPTDTDLRPSHPLLAQRQWLGLLAESGFADAVAFPRRENPADGDASKQVVLMARGPRLEHGVPAVDTDGAAAQAAGTWLVFADDRGVGARLAERLGGLGGRCVMIRPAASYDAAGPDRYALDPSLPEHVRRLLRDALGPGRPPCRGAIHLWSLDTPSEITAASLRTAQVLGCGSVLHLAQALLEDEVPAAPKLWIVTSGTQDIGTGGAPVAFAQTPLRGLAMVIAAEHPELRATSVDLGHSISDVEIDSLCQELRADDPEGQIALRGAARYALRLVRRPPEDEDEGRVEASADRPYHLEITTPGLFDNLALLSRPRRALEPDQIEIRVRAAGLNFRDILKAIGVYPPDTDGPPWLGDECAGEVVAIGAGVTDLAVGDAVMGTAPGCFGSSATTLASSVARKPAHLSFEEAATIPVAFMTAWYALHHLARLRRGERVLIHAAAGGVGLAAIQIAQRVGAEIFATAGSPTKREYLRSLGVPHVMDSRTLAFADEVMELTSGQGVDVVLNSLAGAFIPKSLSTLRANGRFLEIGKRDIYEHTRLDLGFLKNNIFFFAIDLMTLFREQRAVSGEMLNQVMGLFEEGALEPLPLQTFPISEAANAFRYMAQAKHIGKVVVSVPERGVRVTTARDGTTAFQAEATYLITGGLGGVGLTLAGWMAARGARHLVLMGRSEPTPATLAALEAIRESGAEVVVARADVTREEEVARVLRTIETSMPALRGVIHAAMVLDDSAVRQLSLDRLQKVMAPKLFGAWNLHALTAALPLDFFVLFSSSAALVGAPGQANYVAANAGLHGLAHYRRARGLPAMAIDWGRLSVGYVTRHDDIGERLDRLGAKAFTADQMLAILDGLLRLNPIQVGAMDVDFGLWGQMFRAAADSLYMSHIMSQARAWDSGAKGSASGSAILTSLRGASPEERRRAMESFVRHEIAKSLRLDPSRLDLQQSLGSIGLDSLMGLELKNRFQTDLGVDLPMTTLMQNPSIAQLAATLLAQLPEGDAAPAAAPRSEARAAAARAPGQAPLQPGPVERRDEAPVDVAHLSDDEVDTMLNELLAAKSATTDGDHL